MSKFKCPSSEGHFLVITSFKKMLLKKNYILLIYVIFNKCPNLNALIAKDIS